MKNTTKFLLVIMISLIGFQSYAQSFGVKGGLNLANLLDKDDDDTWSNDYKMNMGFHIGATMNYPFTDAFSLETGLLLDTKGFKYEEEAYGAEVKLKGNLYYIDIPITLKASYDIGNNLVMYGTFGPYIGMGLSGKLKIEVKYEGDTETEEEKIIWGNDEEEDDLKRFDFGLAFGGGVEISAIQIGVSYDLGLANISPYTDDGTIIQNRVLKFSVGYKFGL